jgi:hypothetical protein
MASPNFSLCAQEIQCGNFLYGAYFDRLKFALGGVRILLRAAFLGGAYIGVLSGWPGVVLQGVKDGLAWGFLAVMVVQLLRYVDSQLAGCQGGLLKSAEEVQAVTSGDPALYKVYVDLHWREWLRQAFCRVAMSLILAGLVVVGYGLGVPCIKNIFSLLHQGDISGWFMWYCATGVLVQGVKAGVQKLLSLYAAIQERLDLKLEVEKVKELQEKRWREAVVKSFDSRVFGQKWARCDENGSPWWGIEDSGRKVALGVELCPDKGFAGQSSYLKRGRWS